MPPALKRPRSPSLQTFSRSLSPLTATPPASPKAALPPDSPHKAKKLKLLSDYATVSPFPNFPRPTPQEAREVHDILAKEHPDGGVFRKPPKEDHNAAGTCGGVPNVIESLIGTILSQNTSNKNSSAAKRSLDQAFGRNDFAAIASAPRADVVEAIRHGGLANKKAEVIQDVLHEIKRRHGDYSLQHLALGYVAPTNDDDKPKMDAEDATDTGYSDAAIMHELVSYSGVGPKTASCVLLFCLGRASFAVDTHVFRLSKILGWVPPQADRVTAQAHLDLKIPDDLKYGLHVMMVGHGRRCKGCRPDGKSKGKGKGEEGCVLRKWVRERRSLGEDEVEDVVKKVDEEVKLEEEEVKVEQVQHSRRGGRKRVKQED